MKVKFRKWDPNKQEYESFFIERRVLGTAENDSESYLIVDKDANWLACDFVDERAYTWIVIFETSQSAIYLRNRRG